LSGCNKQSDPLDNSSNINYSSIIGSTQKGAKVQMSHGQFKFVLDKNGTLHIGYSNHDYHKDICGGLPRGQVRAAGYLFWMKEDEIWIVNGNSIGYDMGYDVESEKKIQEILGEKTTRTLEDEMAKSFSSRIRLTA
jgi:hypothetical protein